MTNLIIKDNQNPPDNSFSPFWASKAILCYSTYTNSPAKTWRRNGNNIFLSFTKTYSIQYSIIVSTTLVVAYRNWMWCKNFHYILMLKMTFTDKLPWIITINSLISYTKSEHSDFQYKIQSDMLHQLSLQLPCKLTNTGKV